MDEGGKVPELCSFEVCCCSFFEVRVVKSAGASETAERREQENEQRQKRFEQVQQLGAKGGASYSAEN